MPASRRIAVSSAIALVVAALACGGSMTPSASTAAAPAAAAAPATTDQLEPAFPPAPPDTSAAIRSRAVEMMMQRIAGKENMPAESAFTNVQVFKRVPAGRFLGIMNSFGHSLGVSCGFCHVPGRWSSDEKPTKQIARDMLAFVGKVNGELRQIPNLPDSNARVSCATCHRGQPKPFPNGERRGG